MVDAQVSYPSLYERRVSLRRWNTITAGVTPSSSSASSTSASIATNNKVDSKVSTCDSIWTDEQWSHVHKSVRENVLPVLQLRPGSSDGMSNRIEEYYPSLCPSTPSSSSSSNVSNDICRRRQWPLKLRPWNTFERYGWQDHHHLQSSSHRLQVNHRIADALSHDKHEALVTVRATGDLVMERFLTGTYVSSYQLQHGAILFLSSCQNGGLSWTLWSPISLIPISPSPFVSTPFTLLALGTIIWQCPAQSSSIFECEIDDDNRSVTANGYQYALNSTYLFIRGYIHTISGIAIPLRALPRVPASIAQRHVNAQYDGKKPVRGDEDYDSDDPDNQERDYNTPLSFQVGHVAMTWDHKRIGVLSRSHDDTIFIYSPSSLSHAANLVQQEPIVSGARSAEAQLRERYTVEETLKWGASPDETIYLTGDDHKDDFPLTPKEVSWRRQYRRGGEIICHDFTAVGECAWLVMWGEEAFRLHDANGVNIMVLPIESSSYLSGDRDGRFVSRGCRDLIKYPNRDGPNDWEVWHASDCVTPGSRYYRRPLWSWPARPYWYGSYHGKSIRDGSVDHVQWLSRDLIVTSDNRKGELMMYQFRYGDDSPTPLHTINTGQPLEGMTSLYYPSYVIRFTTKYLAQVLSHPSIAFPPHLPILILSYALD
jgi:hypothetical protein